jgi:hypothetical protein
MRDALQVFLFCVGAHRMRDTVPKNNDCLNDMG